VVRQELFFALALGIKLSFQSMQQPLPNLRIHDLYSEAKHLPFAEWNEWISRRFSESVSQARMPTSPSTAAAAALSPASASSTGLQRHSTQRGRHTVARPPSEMSSAMPPTRQPKKGTRDARARPGGSRSSTPPTQLSRRPVSTAVRPLTHRRSESALLGDQQQQAGSERRMRVGSRDKRGKRASRKARRPSIS
jgi:hypothetical protein